VFFGTPEWAVPSLEALLASDIDVAAVVTNPDRPAGRGMELRPSPIKARALAVGLPVLQPEKARDPDLHQALEDMSSDVATVVAYGKILPAALLAVPRLGFVNVHFSLLPAYRGAAPVQRALMDGVTETGVTIIVLTEGMDEGPMLARRSIEVADTDSAGAVGERLADMGAELLVEALHGYDTGTIVPEEQDHAHATYAPKVSPEEARIDWSKPSMTIRDHARALDPVPGAWTTFRTKRLRVFAVAPREAGPLSPGEIDAGRELVVGTGDGAVALLDAQQQGRRRMTGEELVRGLRPAPGERLE
jgi:methionyl-tRNA formyltransferase